MAKPSKWQYFYAGSWPTKIWMTVVTLLAVVAFGYFARPTELTMRNWLDVLLFVGEVLVAGVAGWFAALLFGWPILGPMYYGRAIENGAPFQKGDYVRVLTGPFRDRVARVYDVWEARAQVCVELSEEAKRKAEDVFSDFQVCREEAPPEAAKDGIS